MKVKSVSSHILRAPLGAQNFYSSQAAFPERNSYLVRVETDSGLVGWGEGGQYGPPEPVAACRRRCFWAAAHRARPDRAGEDLGGALRILPRFRAEGHIYRGDLRHRYGALGHLGPSRESARLENARRAFPRQRDRLRHGCYYPDNFRDMPAVLRALEKEASGYADAGFQFLKIKVGLLSLATISSAFASSERLSVRRSACLSTPTMPTTPLQPFAWAG